MHRMPLMVSGFVSFMFPFRSSFAFSHTPPFDLDGPEYGPGAIFGASGASTSSASTILHVHVRDCVLHKRTSHSTSLTFAFQVQ